MGTKADSVVAADSSLIRHITDDATATAAAGRTRQCAAASPRDGPSTVKADDDVDAMSDKESNRTVRAFIMMVVVVATSERASKKSQ